MPLAVNTGPAHGRMAFRATLMEPLYDSLGRNTHTSGCWRSFGRVVAAAPHSSPLLVFRPVSRYLLQAPDTDYLPTACIYGRSRGSWSTHATSVGGRWQVGVWLIGPSQLLSVPSAPQQHHCSVTVQVGVYQISNGITWKRNASSHLLWSDMRCDV